MRKNLTKVLAQVAKDGDVETVAEIIGEMLGLPSEDPENFRSEAAEEPVTEEPVTVKVPENREITIDEDSLAGILQRLDRIIELLAPAAQDEDPVEEIVEAVGEAVEEAVENSEFRIQNYR